MRILSIAVFNSFPIFMSASFLFFLGITFFVLHEMDAVRCKEWRIFPGLSQLNDLWGKRIFLLAHIPIGCFIVWQLTASRSLQNFRMGFDVFLVIHLVAHLVYLKHAENQFKDWISWTLILGAGICGLFDLIF